jgi:hypothetical protein
MTLNASNVRVALTGAAYVGPPASVLPATPEAMWGTGFVDLGYISEDGITEAHDDEVTEHKAWQNGAVVRTDITGSKATFSFTLIETTAAGVGLYYKGTPVTGEDDGPATVEIRTPSPDPRTFGFDVIDGLEVIRTTIAIGQVTERGEIVYKNDEPVGYELTVTAYPDGEGVCATKMFSSLDGLPAGV